MRQPVYLDYAASTPVDPEVAAAMSDCLNAPALYANPSAAHGPGRAALARIEQARAEVAALLNAAPAEIVWTSGATEANNLAIIGAARFRSGRGRHLVSALTEHSSVLEAFRYLERSGFRVTWLMPDGEGLISPAAVAGALRPDTTLVSVMYVNNETGVIQDIAAIGALCRDRGVLFHSDAVQAAGRLPLDLQRLPVDLLSLSAHKIGGPKGVGALFLSQKHLRRVEPLFHGGGQERGLRPGTLPLHQCVGMGVACRLAAARMAADTMHRRALRDALWEAVGQVPGVLLNGHPERRADHILNVSVTGVEGESLLLGLGDLAVAPGAACSSGSGSSSHVLRGLGRPPHLAASSLRFSVGRETTEGEIAFAAGRFREAVGWLRGVGVAGEGGSAGIAAEAAPTGGRGRSRLKPLPRLEALPQVKPLPQLKRLPQVKPLPQLEALPPLPGGYAPGVLECFAAVAEEGGGVLPEEGVAVEGAAGSEPAGARVVFALRLAGETVAAAAFRVYGCPHVMAACRLLAGWLPGRSIRALERPDWGDLLVALEIPAEKAVRLLIVEDALRNCFADWDTRRPRPP